MPRALFDYIDRGSYDELTWKRNRDDLRAAAVAAARHGRRVAAVGRPRRCSASTGTCRSASRPPGSPGFSIATARSRRRAPRRRPACRSRLSTMSICSIEDVRAAVDGTFWFQLYLMRDRGFNEALIARAREARCSALMLTLDLPLQALRRRDPKNGLSVPPRLTVAQRPGKSCCARAGCIGVLFGKRRTLRQSRRVLSGARHRRRSPNGSAAQFDPSISWKDVAWVRERWPGKLIVKGILDAEDARLAVDAGVDAIVVSNHGGRQLDGATSTIAALPRVVDAVAGRCEVLLDGGITSGPGRAQGAGAGRARLPHRQGLSLRSCRAAAKASRSALEHRSGSELEISDGAAPDVERRAADVGFAQYIGDVEHAAQPVSRSAARRLRRSARSPPARRADFRA